MTADSIEAYVASFPADVQHLLNEALRRIRAASAGAAEAIRYGMPAFRLRNGHPVYLAAWNRHLSLHDIPDLGRTLDAEVAPYRSGTDTLKFPYNRPIPYDLIERLVAHIAQTAE